MPNCLHTCDDGMSFFMPIVSKKKNVDRIFLLTSFFAVRFVTKKDFFQLCLSISLKPITFIDLLLFFLWWYLRKKFSVGNIEIWGGNRIKRNCFVFKDRTLIYFNEHFQRKQNPWFITAMKDQTLSALDITFLENYFLKNHTRFLWCVFLSIIDHHSLT